MCGFVPLTAAEQAAKCRDGNACTEDLCLVANGTCTHPPTNTPECTECTPTTCGTNVDLCNPVFCFKACNDPQVRNAVACAAAVSASGTYCEVQPVTCPPNDFCTNWVCSSGVCQSSPATTCATGNPCNVGQCSTQAGACVYSDPCLSVSFGAQPCLQPLCEQSNTTTQGFVCFGPSSPARDCTDYLCTATGVQSETVIGAASANAFKANYVSQNATCREIVCTIDSCDGSSTRGCVNQARSCAAPASQPCNASIGCYEAGNLYGYPSGVCLLVTVQSLIDFCGVCLGDNLACFFSSVNNAAVAGGIAGGAVAGIVVACVIAALIAAWASKRGYDYYQAQSQLQSTGAHQNPVFLENSNAGEMPVRY